MGNIKTKKRNRMLTQKLRDLAFLQLELRHQQAKSGLVRQRLNRSFGNKQTHSSLTSEKKSSQHGLLDDLAIVEEVRDELSGGDEDDEDDEDVEEHHEADKDTEAGMSRNSTFGSLIETYSTKESNQDEDSHGTIVNQESSRPSMPQKVRVFFGQQRHIPIENLFNWNIEEGWDKYWFEGVKNCRQEMEFYDLVSSMEKEVGKDTDSVERTTSGGGLGAT